MIYEPVNTQIEKDAFIVSRHLLKTHHAEPLIVGSALIGSTCPSLVP